MNYNNEHEFVNFNEIRPDVSQMIFHASIGY